MKTPFYNPQLSYEDNYREGPFGNFAKTPKKKKSSSSPELFLNLPVDLPFGIPAGPLLNANFVKAALNYGFDLVTYKTVRTRAVASHPLPNVLAIHHNGNIKPLETVLADQNFQEPISITNSFGVPSFDPDIWQSDLQDAVQYAKKGQAVIASFQGTGSKLKEDYVLAARLVAETNAPIMEANLSCPNEGIDQLLCFDAPKVERIANAIKDAVPDRPLLLKLAYFDHNLDDLIKRLNGVVDGFSTINTIPAKPVTSNGLPALGNERPTAGVCGNSIRWAGLEMVHKLAKIRDKLSANYAIIGVGGVSSKTHYEQYRKAGADAVMSATGAMWNPDLAFEIKS